MLAAISFIAGCASILRSKDDTLYSINIEYDSDDWDNRTNGKGFDWIFSFDEKTNILYVPLIWDNDDIYFVTDQYLQYQIKDNYFRYVGTGCGYWRGAYRWRKEYGGMGTNEAKRLKELEKENDRLKKLVANLSLDNAILRDVNSKNF